MFTSCNSSEFNSQSWKLGNERERGKMSANLIDNKILENKTKEEVMKLLGNPDRQNENCISYQLDFFEIIDWSYTLKICFNKTTRKSNYVQIND